MVTVTWNGTHKYKLNLVFLIWSDKNVSKLLNANAANLFVYLTLGEKLSQFVFDLLDLKKFDFSFKALLRATCQTFWNSFEMLLWYLTFSTHLYHIKGNGDWVMKDHCAEIWRNCEKGNNVMLSGWTQHFLHKDTAGHSLPLCTQRNRCCATSCLAVKLYPPPPSLLAHFLQPSTSDPWQAEMDWGLPLSPTELNG